MFMKSLNMKADDLWTDDIELFQSQYATWMCWIRLYHYQTLQMDVWASASLTVQSDWSFALLFVRLKIHSHRRGNPEVGVINQLSTLTNEMYLKLFIIIYKYTVQNKKNIKWHKNKKNVIWDVNRIRRSTQKL